MTQTKQTQLRQPKQWSKVESANFFRFEKIGDTIAGMLIEKTPGGKMNFYKIRTFEGDEKKFHGSNQLDDLLSQFTPPCYLRITFADEMETAMGTMKLFEVEKGEN
jgi:ribosomal protein L13